MRLILLALLGFAASGQATPRHDGVIAPFTAEVQVTPGFLDATRAKVVGVGGESGRA